MKKKTQCLIYFQALEKIFCFPCVYCPFLSSIVPQSGIANKPKLHLAQDCVHGVQYKTEEDWT